MNANIMEKLVRSFSILVFVVGITSTPGRSALAQPPAQVSGNDVLYTTDQDFDLGTLVSVNHNEPYSNQLQLDSPTKPFPFINVAASGRGTVVRTNTETGEIVGEYRTAPEGRGLNPSRTTVDLFGNVWTANRDEAGVIDDVLYGSVVKIGLIVGGARVNEMGIPDPNGGYLAPPFGYNTCVDRNGDGLIRTSKGLYDVLDWPDLTDGMGGEDGIVQDAVDECILIYQRLPNAENARHVSVDADNNVWVGGYPYAVRTFYKLDGSTGALLDSFDARKIGCGGYGGLVDGNGILWSVGGDLLRYDPVAHTGFCIPQGGYGLGIDTGGYIWMSLWDGGIVKIAPDGTVMPGFPKPTFPPSMTTLPVMADGTRSLMITGDTGNSNLPLPDRAPSMKPLQGYRRIAISHDEMQPLSEPLAGDPTVTFWVSPVDNWVQSSSPWTPGATISLTISDGGSVVYADSHMADAGGNFFFNLWEDQFDLQRGQLVTVSDGTTTKTHTVMPLYVQHIDMGTDMISGTGAANTAVDLWVHGDGGTTVTADSSGNWTADFSGVTNLTYLSDGGSAQSDEDGDATGVWWASPRFQVAPNDDWVQASGDWTPGATISLTISDGGAVVFSDSQTADSDGHFNFNVGDVFDLQRGQVVTVSDGTTTKTHSVADLFVDGINVSADTVSGRAGSGTSVNIWVDGDGNQTALADSSGAWTADFSGQTDITSTSTGGSQQDDTDGDSTYVWWGYPSLRVNPDDDWVESRQSWRPGATVMLTIQDGGTVVYSDSQIADSHGNFGFYLWNVFDLQRGQVVTVTDGVTTKIHTVMDLYVDLIDVAGDRISGRATPGTSVDVWVNGDGELKFVAGDSGNWTADFSSMTDITYLSDGSARQVDDDGDVTRIDWSSPRFQVAPDDDWVQSWNHWTPGARITLTIQDGGAVVYSESLVTDAHGDFNFNLWSVFNLQRGQVVTVSDGTNTKTHTVMPLYVDNINVTADTISGRGLAGTDVEVWVHGDGDLTVAPDSSGNWTADFSAQTDLTYLNDGGSRQVDEDGDTTGVWWSSPAIQVAPDDNWVQSWNRWPAGATVTMTIARGGALQEMQTQTVGFGGGFNFGSLATDLATGDLVTVTDGRTTKALVVNGLSIDAIDTTADRVHGMATPGARLWIWAYLFNDGSGRTVYADATGNWTADFSVSADGQPAFDINSITFVNGNEFDEEADSTFRRAGPPLMQNRGVAVTQIDDNVWVANSAYDTVTRLDSEGNVVKVIVVGDEPTGVAVDAAGMVWATNMSSNSAVCIDPNAGTDGLGAVDMTVDLGQDAWPYNYSDMTGAVAVGSTSPQGFWTVIQDSGTPGFEWGRILWNSEPQGSEPPGTAIVVEARVADAEAGLGGEAFEPVANGDLFSMYGRYIEVRVTLKASPEGASPVLSDIRIQSHVIYVDIDIKPGSFPNGINCKSKTEVVTVAILTTAGFDALTVDYATVRFEGALEIHVDRRTGLPVRHVEDVGLDGDLDLVFHFYRKNTALTCASTTGKLTGFTYSGVPIEGTDSVWMVTR